MGTYKHIRETYRKPEAQLRLILKNRLIALRKGPSTERVDRPTRLDRARSLGYRSKQGIFVVRQRVIRGGRQRETIKKGRRPRAQRRVKTINISYKQIAEQRVQGKFKNCEVLNSYFLTKDGRHAWYEVIMVDPKHPSIKSDKKLKWITKPQHTMRVHRGLTSAAKKTRGLRKKGTGSERTRPSKNAQGGRIH